MSTVSATPCNVAVMPSDDFFQFDANSLLERLGDQLIRFWGSKVTADSYFVNTLRDFWGIFTNTAYHHHSDARVKSLLSSFYVSFLQAEAVF